MVYTYTYILYHTAVMDFAAYFPSAVARMKTCGMYGKLIQWNLCIKDTLNKGPIFINDICSRPTVILHCII